jgi:hypothetical protein
MRHWARDSALMGISGTLVEELEKVKDGVRFQTAENGTAIATHLGRMMGARGKVEME